MNSNGRFVLESSSSSFVVSSAKSSMLQTNEYSMIRSASSELLVDTVFSSDTSRMWSNNNNNNHSVDPVIELPSDMGDYLSDCASGFDSDDDKSVSSSPSEQHQEGFMDFNSPALSPLYEQFNQSSYAPVNSNTSNVFASSSSDCYSNAGSPFFNNYSNQSSPSCVSSYYSHDVSNCQQQQQISAIRNDVKSLIEDEQKVIFSSSLVNLNSSASTLLDDDDIKIELNNVSEDSLNISNELPNLQPKDLKLLEQLEQELSITSLPPSPPITPPARFYPCQYQSGAISPAAVCIKQEIKSEPVEIVQQATAIWSSQNRVVKLECSPQAAPSPAYSNYSDSMVPMSPSLEQKRRYPNTKDCLHVAEFLLGLLLNPETCGDKKLIKWEKKEKGLFRILKPKDVANKWARAKSNKDSMNYPNMARGIRFARVKSGDFELVTKSDGVGKKLVYKFSQRFRSRNAELSSFMLPY